MRTSPFGRRSGWRSALRPTFPTGRGCWAEGCRRSCSPPTGPGLRRTVSALPFRLPFSPPGWRTAWGRWPLRRGEAGSRSPFQVMSFLQNFPAPDLSVAGLTLTPFEAEQSVDMGTAVFDLTLAVTEREDGLQVSATYNDHLFEAGTIRRMLGHYRTLLEAVAADPERPLSAYSLMKDDERRLLLSWSGQVTAPGDDMAVHRAFEQQAARAPGAIAVTQEEREFSYAELNRRANQLARRLRSLGVGPEVRVGIHLERSPEMVVAALGVLKAGGAYVPLDPASPK